MNTATMTIDEIRAEAERIAEDELQRYCPDPPDEQDREQDAVGGDRRHAVSCIIDPKRVVECLYRNQVGDGELFTELHRGRFLYDHAAGRWYRWSGHYWQEDKTEAVVQAVQNIVSVYEDELQKISWRSNAARSRDKPDKAAESLEKTLRQRITTLQSRSRIMDVLQLSRSHPAMATGGDEWDSDPMLLGTLNGVIDLASGEFRDGRPEDMIRTIAPVEWQGLNAPCPVWQKAISDIFSDDVADYIQKLIGYSISGKVVHHLLVVCYGAGSNGKSLFFETLGAVLGDLAGQLPSESLLVSESKSSGGQARSDLMALRGKRLVYTTETNSRRALDLARSKMLTGNDTISAREIYGRQTTFKPTWKIFLITNSKPTANASDYGIWRRLVLLPFDHSFVENPTRQHERPIDYELPGKLKAEYPGILAWAIRGCLRWQAEGLHPPDQVRMATEAYRQENDLVKQFVEEACIVTPDVRCKPSALYQAYCRFCADEGGVPESQKKFSECVKNQYRFKDERTSTARWFIGITTRAEYDS